MSVDTYRRKVATLKKKKADLEKKLSQQNEKITKRSSEINRLAASAGRSSNASTVRSKLSQIETKQKDLVRLQKTATSIESDISRVISDLAHTLKSLEQAEQRERKKQDAADKKRRQEELSHVRTLTRESKEQLRIQSEISRLADLPEGIKVLFLAANPQDLTLLRLDEEIRAIREKIRASKHRDSVELVSRWAVRTGDLLQALNEETPHIVHFSGHGSPTEEIMMTDPGGNAKPVSKLAIVQVMNTAAENIELVVFNTCFSSTQAEAVTQHVNAAIGMSVAIGDEAAKVFAAQLYSAIGFGFSVQVAFDQARTALMLEGIPEDETPELYIRSGLDPADLFLVRPPENESLPHVSKS